MFTYTIFDKETGEITGISTTNEEIPESAGRVGVSAILGEYNSSEYFVDKGYAIAYSISAKAEKSVRPSDVHVWSNTLFGWIDQRTEKDHISANRAQRNALLLACDWTQLPDAPGATRFAWMTYRQALRDITNQPDQRNVIWPVAPI